MLSKQQLYAKKKWSKLRLRMHYGNKPKLMSNCNFYLKNETKLNCFKSETNKIGCKFIYDVDIITFLMIVEIDE